MGTFTKIGLLCLDDLEEVGHINFDNFRKAFKNYFTDSRVNKSDVFDVLDDLAETYADNRAKTMPEFERINHLQRVLVACEDIVIESGTPDEMNAKLNGVFQSHVGIGWNRNENLAIESK